MRSAVGRIVVLRRIFRFVSWRRRRFITRVLFGIVRRRPRFGSRSARDGNQVRQRGDSAQTDPRWGQETRPPAGVEIPASDCGNDHENCGGENLRHPLHGDRHRLSAALVQVAIAPGTASSPTGRRQVPGPCGWGLWRNIKSYKCLRKVRAP